MIVYRRIIKNNKSINRLVISCSCSSSSSSSSSSTTTGPVIQKIEQQQYVVEKTPITASLWSLRKNANIPNIPNIPDENDKSTITSKDPIAVVVEKLPTESRLQVRYNFKDDKNYSFYN